MPVKKPRPSPGASISLSFGDDLLTEEGTELTVEATDDAGTKETTVLLPWSDDDPKEPEPQG
jgi:hypothetical protein